MIGLITYDCSHLKTQQLVEQCGNKIDAILLIPFQKRPSRKVIFNHRPSQFEGPSPQELAKSIGAEIIKLSEFKGQLLTKEDFLVIGGAGIIDAYYTSNFQIINAHPGLIPSSRGLDSFKWGILNKITPGITIHQIDENVDMGRLIHHEVTTVYESDNIKSLAERHYRNEINTLSKFICGTLENKLLSNLPINESKMRMSIDKELEMTKKFDEFKLYCCSNA